MRNAYLQSIILGDPLNHVWYSCLENFLERERVHHCEDPSEMFQNFFLLFHAYSLAVSHPDVCLLIICNLYLFNKNYELLHLLVIGIKNRFIAFISAYKL